MIRRNPWQSIENATGRLQDMAMLGDEALDLLPDEELLERHCKELRAITERLRALIASLDVIEKVKR
jgi:hypothetical protein